MIEPTVGRVVLFHPHVNDGHRPGDQPHAALVVHVHNDREVNLAVFTETGAAYSRLAVQLLQDNDQPPAHGHFARWMPYQKGQAAKTEQIAAHVDQTILEELKRQHDDGMASVQKLIDGLTETIMARVDEVAAKLETALLNPLQVATLAPTQPPTHPYPEGGQFSAPSLAPQDAQGGTPAAPIDQASTGQQAPA